MFGMKKSSKQVVEGDNRNNDWRKSGSFMNRPENGWLHSDQTVMGPGVRYAVDVS